MQGRLNLFQCAMLRWRELYPYCASHVISIAMPLDEAHLRETIASVLNECGLTGLVLNAKRRRFAYRGGAASVSLLVVDGADAPFDVAATLIERTLNERFPDEGAYDPFRFFAIRAGREFLLGVTYDHFVAGGDSIVVLVTDLADRYFARSGDPPPSCLVRYPPTYSRLFARHAGAFIRGFASLRGLLAGWRSAIRPHFNDASDGYNGFVHAFIDPARYARLRTAAKRYGVTNNDLLLALVLRGVMPIAACRHHWGKRNQVALASIVNVRADYQPPATEVFGQFLSSFRIVQPFSEGRSLAEIAVDISRQTGRAKREKLYLVTLVAMAGAALLWPFANVARRHRLYLKYHPVFAGLTPLNVDALRRHPAKGDYLRAASTGPMSPLVVAATVSNAALRLGVTFRTTALSRDEAQGVLQSILNNIDTLS